MRGHPLRGPMGRVLVGFDGSPPSRRALDHALRHAGLTKDEVVLLNVIPPSVKESSLARMMPAGIELPPQMGGTFLDHARARLDETVQQAAKSGVSVRGVVALGEPAASLLQAAEEMKVTQIVIGRKSYAADAILGPNAAALIMHATVPLTLVP